MTTKKQQLRKLIKQFADLPESNQIKVLHYFDEDGEDIKKAIEFFMKTHL